MHNQLNRRQFFAGAFMSALTSPLVAKSAMSNAEMVRNDGPFIKYSLNAYSFNTPLRAGELTLFDVIDFCALNNISGLDATGYYFPGYPQQPPDRFIYDLKRKAFLNGITIHGTGIKNDFAVQDEKSRKNDVQMVKNWINVGEKLGASVIRIFSGKTRPEGCSFDQVLEWMVPDIQECAAYGKSHGVMVGLQNHNDFLKTASETIRLVEAVDSDWFGVVLDIGSLRQKDPYQEIAMLLPYAVSWQLKETVWYGANQVPTDMAKIAEIINKSSYRGFLPLETLGSGDPKIKIKKLLKETRKHIKNS